jgi:hypothetical protein
VTTGSAGPRATSLRRSTPANVRNMPTKTAERPRAARTAAGGAISGLRPPMRHGRQPCHLARAVRRKMPTAAVGRLRIRANCPVRLAARAGDSSRGSAEAKSLAPLGRAAANRGTRPISATLRGGADGAGRGAFTLVTPARPVDPCAASEPPRAFRLRLFRP